MMHTDYCIGADIGGTHCTAAVVDLKQRKIVTSSLSRMPLNANAAAGDIIAAWSSCIASAKKDISIAAVCLAMPGPFDYEQGISLMQGQHKYEALYGLNVKQLLAQSLQLTEAAIFMANDAACFLYGEVFGGAAVKHADKTVIGITLGTGLGSAIYKEGTARNADLWCMPFLEGIAEDYLSSHWCVQRFNTLTGIMVSGVRELAQLATSDERAMLVFHEFGNHLAQMLAQFIEMEHPSAVCIGGNISKAFPLFGNILAETLGRRYPHISIEPSILGEEAAMLGAVGSWAFKQQQSVQLPSAL